MSIPPQSSDESDDLSAHQPPQKDGSETLPPVNDASPDDAAGNGDSQDIDEDPWISDEPWISEDSPRKHSAELFPIPGRNSPTAPVDPAAASGSPTTATAPKPKHHQAVGPLPLVETAFLASAASLMWLINTYFPPGPLLRILFPLPIALVYLRWNLRSAWMAATVSGLLLTILLGPTRSIFFVMPYGLLGVQLGCLWRRRARWEVSILTGGILVAIGSFFRIWLLSLLAGEDLWGYTIAQITQLIDWLVRVLTNWGWIGLGAWGQPSMGVIAIAAVLMVLFASIVYLFTVHLAAWLVLERLGVAMPEPPGWVQVLIEE